MKPEVPVEEYVAKEVDITVNLRTTRAAEGQRIRWFGGIEAAEVVITRDDEPRGIYAEEAVKVEPFPVLLPHPREPQPDARKKEEYVNAEITHAPKPVEGIGTWGIDMEEHDNDDSETHQFSPIA